MNIFLAKIPLVRLIIPFIAGIIFRNYFVLPLPVFLILFIITLCSFALILLNKLHRRSLRWQGVEGFVISVALFFSGIGLFELNVQDNFNKSNLENALLVRIVNAPVVKEKSIKVLAEAISIKEGKIWIGSNEKILVYFKRDASSEKLNYGDEVLIACSPTEIEAPSNPNEFDYKKWLARQSIFKQAYAKTGDWKLISTGNGFCFKSLALKLRTFFLEKLQSYELSPSAFGVSSALLLGASDHLDSGTLQAYSASGTLHVLSVSGMHVALVYIVLLKLLAPLQRKTKLKVWSIVIQLVFLWFYATLTGLCPSVLRSVTMLTVVIVGKAFNRQSHILNSLAASALILLMFNPLLLFDIGFQLSYLAVAGIVLLQPRLEGIWEPDPSTWKGKIQSHIWTLISVTIVAQVFTFPLGLYYFKQFPVYFLLSNLIVIPLSTIVMYAGLTLLILSPFVLLAKPISVLFSFLVELLNACVAKIEHLPFSVIHSAEWSQMEIIILYSAILFFLLYFIQKQMRFVQFGMMVISALLILVACNNQKILAERKIVIFNINHSTAIGVLEGRNVVLFADTALLKRKGDIDYHIEPFLKSLNIQTENYISIQDSAFVKSNFVHYKQNRIKTLGTEIVLIDKDFENVNAPSGEIILLRNNTNVKLDEMISLGKPKLIIADGSDSPKKIQKWKTICKNRNVAFYDVTVSGALILNGN